MKTTLAATAGALLLLVMPSWLVPATRGQDDRLYLPVMLSVVPDIGASATVSSIVAPIYAQPSTASERIEVVPRGTTLAVTGRNEDGTWIQVISVSARLGGRLRAPCRSM